MSGDRTSKDYAGGLSRESSQRTQSYPTPFFGRAQELLDIQQRISDPACHLLTLVGPGGIGKTRLAQQALAVQPADVFPNGLYFVPLQALTAPDLIVSAVTEAIHLPFLTDRDPKVHLLLYLQDKTMLLLLDNFEQLMGGMELVGDILSAAPQVKLMVTSRERLNMREEWVFDVGGLSFPQDEAEADIDAYEAVQLFIYHAQRVKTGFRLNEAQIGGINRICRMVGGMPLALELAATWLRALTCDEIADEIETGLDILESTDRNQVERHRSMRAVLEHSWALLSGDEQSVLMRLSVFWGGFTREAARAVVGATRHSLTALVDKSWLSWDGEAGRYAFHALLQQFAAEKLSAAGDPDSVRDAHAAYFGAFMEAREQDIKYRRQVEALREIEQDFANVRAAWQWAAARGRHHDIHRMTEALNFFGDMRVRYTEAEEMFRTASAHFDQPETRLLYNRLRARRARMIQSAGLSQLITQEKLWLELEAIVSENRTLDDPAELAFSLFVEAMLIRRRFREELVKPLFEESSRIYQMVEDPFYIAELLLWVSLGVSAPIPLRKQALEIQREIGDENGIGWALLQLAAEHFNIRQFDESKRYLEEALASQRRRGDVKALWATMMFGSDQSREMGEFERALEFAETCYQAAVTMNIAPFKKAAQARLGLMEILTEQDLEQGKMLCSACLMLHMPPSNYFYGFPPDMDAAFGLAVIAYLEHDLASQQTYFQTMLKAFSVFMDKERMPWTAKGGVLVVLMLDTEDRIEQAVEIAACVSSIPEVPNKPIMRWVKRWPLFNRLKEKWAQQLGKAAYTAAWERGAALDAEQTLRILETDYHQYQGMSPVQASSDALTTRELEVLHLLAGGLSNREIADHLVISAGTAKWYVSQIFSKLDVNSRTQAIARARDLHLLA